MRDWYVTNEESKYKSVQIRRSRGAEPGGGVTWMGSSARGNVVHADEDDGVSPEIAKHIRASFPAGDRRTDPHPVIQNRGRVIKLWGHFFFG